MEDEPQRPGGLRMEEAERLFQSLLERAQEFTKRTAALAREEVEDLFTEAKELKQRQRAPS